MSEEVENSNALRDNIKSKGENAYYYAHATNIGSEYKTTVGDTVCDRFHLL